MNYHQNKVANVSALYKTEYVFNKNGEKAT